MGRKLACIVIMAVGVVFLAHGAGAQMHHEMMEQEGREPEQPRHEEGGPGPVPPGEADCAEKHIPGPGMGGQISPGMMAPGMGEQMYPGMMAPGMGGQMYPGMMAPGTGGQMYPGMMAPGRGGQMYPGMMVYPGMIVFPGIIVYPGMMGYGGIGPGMMGHGKMWPDRHGREYGHHRGPGYSRPGKGMMHHGEKGAEDCRKPQLESSGEPLDEEGAKQLLERYLQALGNPNLKAGDIRDEEQYFEAEVLTQDGSLVDKILIDKNTGRMRSAY